MLHGKTSKNHILCTRSEQSEHIESKNEDSRTMNSCYSLKHRSALCGWYKSLCMWRT